MTEWFEGYMTGLITVLSVFLIRRAWNRGSDESGSDDE